MWWRAGEPRAAEAGSLLALRRRARVSAARRRFAGSAGQRERDWPAGSSRVWYGGRCPGREGAQTRYGRMTPSSPVLSPPFAFLLFAFLSCVGTCRSIKCITTPVCVGTCRCVVCVCFARKIARNDMGPAKALSLSLSGEMRDGGVGCSMAWRFYYLQHTTTTQAATDSGVLA